MDSFSGICKEVDEWTTLNTFLLDQQCMSMCSFVFPLGFLLLTSFIDNCKIRKLFGIVIRPYTVVLKQKEGRKLAHSLQHRSRIGSLSTLVTG